jgi:RNA polymerase-binding transcription factor DksA
MTSTESILFRQRLAKALAAGGLSEQQVAAEVLLLLPAEFLTAYEVLYLETWQKASGSISVGDENAEVPVATKWRVSTNQTETRGTASTKGRGSLSKGLGVKSTRAAATKDWADRKLRKLAREISMRLSDEDAPIRRCAGRCRRLAEDTWNYCPNCGSPTEEVD